MSPILKLREAMRKAKGGVNAHSLPGALDVQGIK
jgi:hypothetical protein